MISITYTSDIIELSFLSLHIMYVYSPAIIITVENTHKNENKIFTLFQWNFDKKYYILGSLAISREVKKHCNIRLDGCVRVDENSSL